MGKSGSFFFFSHDDTFLIKTMTVDDFRAFRKMFQYYFHHINIYRKSLIAPIYGVYSVKMDDKEPVFLILMGNTKKKCQNCHMKRIFDLKGSLVKREVFKPAGVEEFKNTAVLKDKNLLQMKKQENSLRFDNKDIPKIMKQMGLDISLLHHFNLMDYSLLFVVEINPKYIEFFPNEF